MGFLFSRPKRQAESPAKSDRLTGHRLAREIGRMTRLIRGIEKHSKDLLAAAKAKGLAGDREGAIAILRRLKARKKPLATWRGSLAKLQELEESIHRSKEQARTLAILEEATGTLQRLNDQVPIDRVEAAIEAQDDALAQQEAVDDLLLGDLATGVDSELEAELDSMMGLDAAAPAAAAPAAAAPAAAAPAAAAPAAAAAEEAPLDIGAMPSVPAAAAAPASARTRSPARVAMPA